MKLKQFNKANSSQMRIGEPTVRVSGKAGLINFSSTFCREAKLQAGVRVQFHQDEEKPQNWYVEIVTDEDGFILREDKDAKQCSLNSTGVAHAILKSLGQSTEASIACRMAIEPSVIEGFSLYPIITRAIK